MATEAKQWRIFRCPSCETMLKVSKDSKARALKCPKCKSTVKLPAKPESSATTATSPPPKNELPETAGASEKPTAFSAPPSIEPEDDPTPSQESKIRDDDLAQDEEEVLPSQREYDPTPEGLKEPRENWEAQRHKRKKLEFKEKLAATSDDEFQVDPDREPVVRRRRYVGGSTEESAPSWDDEDNYGTSAKKSNLPMIIMLVAALLMGGTALLVSIMVKKDSGESLLTDIFRPSTETELANSLDPAEFHGEVTEVLKNFLEADSVDEMIGYIRDPARVAPIARTYYRERAVFEKPHYVKLPEPGELQSHQKYMISLIEIEDEHPRIVAMEQTKDGFKIDWESWVGYSKISWDLFTSRRMIDTNEFRALITRDDYYNFKYSDFVQWRCYQLRDPDEKHRLYGYVERNGDIDKMLQRAMLRSQFAFVVVKLRYPANNPEDKRGTQVEIVELVEEGWVLREDNDYDPDARTLDGPFDFK